MPRTFQEGRGVLSSLSLLFFPSLGSPSMYIAIGSFSLLGLVCNVSSNLNSIESVFEPTNLDYAKSLTMRVKMYYSFLLAYCFLLFCAKL